MKRLSVFLLSILMLLSAVAPVAASNDIKVIVDGTVVNFDVQPQIIDGRTMVPLRAIFEALGATVDWNESTKTITANKGDLFVKCAIGSYSMDTSNGTKTIDVPPTIINSRTLVPARFIAEGFNCDVQWDAANRRVTITSAPVEYVIVEHGDKKDEQKDNTVKKSDSTVKNNKKTEQNYPVKNSDSESNSSSAFDELAAYVKRNGDREKSISGDGYTYTIKNDKLSDVYIAVSYDEPYDELSFTTMDWFLYSSYVAIYITKNENPSVYVDHNNKKYFSGEITSSSLFKHILGDLNVLTATSDAKSRYSRFNEFLDERGLDIKLSDLNEFLVED